jgi:virginiamycin B lyase
MWFTETGANNVGRLTAGGGLVELPLPSASNTSSDPQPAGIAAGPKNTIWVAEPGAGANSIACIGQNC